MAGKVTPGLLSYDILDDNGDLSSAKIARIYEASKSWPAEQKKAALNYLEGAATREKIRRTYNGPAEIAAAVDPDFIITRAIGLISEALEEGPLSGEPRQNLIITMPPQEGKSTIACVWTPIRAWQKNPNRRIILTSYGDDLAHTHSLALRTMIEQHGGGVIDPVTGVSVVDKLGIRIATKSKRVDAFRIDGARGGLVAAGLGSAITGRAADLFIIDDPYKNMQEADSETHREKVNTWMATVARTRLSPQASMILIQTRWHQDDLAGATLAAERALDEEFRTWRHINIPAISQEGIDDALERPRPGISMDSARGRTKEEFENTHRDVGDRFFLAMYQGSPTNPEGGLFARAWFNPPMEMPERAITAVVAVDPADSGEGDETGILGGVALGDGSLLFTEDWSATLTSDQWGREAVWMALEIGAREIVLEGYSVYNTYRNVVIKSWEDIAKESREKLARGGDLSPRELRALVPNMPFLVTKYTETGDAEGRASMIRKDFERKRCRVVPFKMHEFIEQATMWQTGQHCPDRVSAGTILHWKLDKLIGGRVSYGHPLQQRPTGPPPERLTRRISDGGRGLPIQSRGIVSRFPDQRNLPRFGRPAR